MNMYILYKLTSQLKKLVASAPEEEREFQIQGAGCLFHIFKKLFKVVDRYAIAQYLSRIYAWLTCSIQTLEDVPFGRSVWSRV